VRGGPWRASQKVKRQRQFFDSKPNKYAYCLHLSDWISVLEVDLSYTPTLVLGSVKRSATGLPIGSPISAGGATLVASWREHLVWTLQSHDLRQEFHAKVFLFRWLDDVLIVASQDLSPGLRCLVRTLTSPYFYGRRLLLKPTNSSEAFGFRVSVKHGLLELRPVLRFALTGERRAAQGASRTEHGGLCPTPGLFSHGMVAMTGGQQYRGTNVDYAVAIGHCVRLLDTTNAGEVEVLAFVFRTLCELRRVGIHVRVLKRAVSRVQRASLCRLRVLRTPLTWPRLESEGWCRAYDRMYLQTCRTDDALRSGAS